MLGIVANLSDMLQDVQSRKSDESKQKVLRGLNAFVTAVGSSINAIAPQVSMLCSVCLHISCKGWYRLWPPFKLQ